MEVLVYLGSFLTLLVIGYVTGSLAEARHYRFIEYRERLSAFLPVITSEDLLETDREVERIELVWGIAVISVDYFKRMLAALRSFFGGRTIAFETLLDRARREALLRMKKMALGADIVLNFRIATVDASQSANQEQPLFAVAAIAYGTAVTFKKNS